jgi:hypothetical protein
VRSLAVSPRLDEDIQDLTFTVYSAPDVQLSAVDGDEHFVEMSPSAWPRPSSSQPARNDRAELQSPASDRLIGHIDATLGEHILDIAVAQTEAEIEPNGLLNDDARKAMAVVGKLVHKRTLYGSPVPSQHVTVTVPIILLRYNLPARRLGNSNQRAEAGSRGEGSPTGGAKYITVEARNPLTPA